MKNTMLQTSIAGATVALLVLLSDPFMLFMPPIAAMIALVGVTVLLCVWVGMVMNERGGDERETVHRQTAGRVAYLSGIAVLTFALLVQGFQHRIDPWIAGALAAMVLAKLATHFYTSRYN